MEFGGVPGEDVRRPAPDQFAFWVLDTWAPTPEAARQEKADCVTWSKEIEERVKKAASHWGAKFGYRVGFDRESFVGQCLVECHRKVSEGKVKFPSTVYVICRNVAVQNGRYAKRRPACQLTADVRAVSTQGQTEDRVLAEEVGKAFPLLLMVAKAEADGLKPHEIAAGLKCTVKELNAELEKQRERARIRFGV